jgi:hypothetical protein
MTSGLSCVRASCRLCPGHVFPDGNGDAKRGGQNAWSGGIGVTGPRPVGQVGVLGPESAMWSSTQERP